MARFYDPADYDADLDPHGSPDGGIEPIAIVGDHRGYWPILIGTTWPSQIRILTMLLRAKAPYLQVAHIVELGQLLLSGTVCWRWTSHPAGRPNMAWNSGDGHQLDHEELGMAVVRVLVEAGALRFASQVNVRTRAIEQKTIVDADGLDYWEAACLLKLEDE